MKKAVIITAIVLIIGIFCYFLLSHNISPTLLTQTTKPSHICNIVTNMQSDNKVVGTKERGCSVSYTECENDICTPPLVSIKCGESKAVCARTLVCECNN